MGSTNLSDSHFASQAPLREERRDHRRHKEMDKTAKDPECPRTTVPADKPQTAEYLRLFAGHPDDSNDTSASDNPPRNADRHARKSKGSPSNLNMRRVVFPRTLDRRDMVIPHNQRALLVEDNSWTHADSLKDNPHLHIPKTLWETWQVYREIREPHSAGHGSSSEESDPESNSGGDSDSVKFQTGEEATPVGEDQPVLGKSSTSIAKNTQKEDTQTRSIGSASPAASDSSKSIPWSESPPRRPQRPDLLPPDSSDEASPSPSPSRSRRPLQAGKIAEVAHEPRLSPQLPEIGTQTKIVVIDLEEADDETDAAASVAHAHASVSKAIAPALLVARTVATDEKPESHPKPRTEVSSTLSSPTQQVKPYPSKDRSGSPRGPDSTSLNSAPGALMGRALSKEVERPGEDNSTSEDVVDSVEDGDSHSEARSEESPTNHLPEEIDHAAQEQLQIEFQSSQRISMQRTSSADSTNLTNIGQTNLALHDLEDELDEPTTLHSLESSLSPPHVLHDGFSDTVVGKRKALELERDAELSVLSRKRRILRDDVVPQSNDMESFIDKQARQNRSAFYKSHLAEDSRHTPLPETYPSHTVPIGEDPQGLRMTPPPAPISIATSSGAHTPVSKADSAKDAAATLTRMDLSRAVQVARVAVEMNSPGDDFTSLTYQKFKDKYQDYTAGKGHFVNLCSKIVELDRIGSPLHRSLWDDFIATNWLEYRQYLSDSSEAGCDPLPYADYYYERIESPAYMANIITPHVLTKLLSNSLSASHGAPSPSSAGTINQRTSSSRRTSAISGTGAAGLAHSNQSGIARRSSNLRRSIELAVEPEEKDFNAEEPLIAKADEVTPANISKMSTATPFVEVNTVVGVPSVHLTDRPPISGEISPIHGLDERPKTMGNFLPWPRSFTQPQPSLIPPKNLVLEEIVTSETILSSHSEQSPPERAATPRIKPHLLPRISSNDKPLLRERDLPSPFTEDQTMASHSTVSKVPKSYQRSVSPPSKSSKRRSMPWIATSEESKLKENPVPTNLESSSTLRRNATGTENIPQVRGETNKATKADAIETTPSPKTILAREQRKPRDDHNPLVRDNHTSGSSMVATSRKRRRLRDEEGAPSRTQNSWHLDPNTPYNQFERSYKRLKVEEERTKLADTAVAMVGGIDILSWMKK